MKNKKKAKWESEPKGSKQATFIEPDVLSQTPVWSFLRTDFDGIPKTRKVVWRRLSIDDIVSMFEHLKSYEQRTWNAIIHENRRRDHPMPISTLINEAREYLTNTLRIDQGDEIFRLRFEGKIRLWGFKKPGSRVFEIIWFDPEHEIYPVEKKGT